MCKKNIGKREILSVKNFIPLTKIFSLLDCFVVVKEEDKNGTARMKSISKKARYGQEKIMLLGWRGGKSEKGRMPSNRKKIVYHKILA